MNRKRKNILVISSYPTKRAIHDKKVVGIASYAKNTLLALKSAEKDTKIDILVLAEQLDGEEKSYTSKKIRVDRVWKRGSFGIFPTLFREILKRKNATDTVLIEFELSMFGGILHLLPFPVFLLLLKLLRKRTVLVSHQVISDLREIAPHINLSQSSEVTSLYALFMRLFYRLVLRLSSRVIVFEEELKRQLSAFGNKKKIIVIPHGVETFNKIPTKKEARKKLGVKQDEFAVLVFGYLAWYKGSDWVADAVGRLKSQNKRAENIRLILAGGPNPNHADKEYYKKYISGIESVCKKNNILLTGFVEEKDIPLYYQASDIVVLPYRTFMSASGPLSISFSFKKPFLLSHKLKDTLLTSDISAALSSEKLKPQDLYFTDFNGDFGKKLLRIKNNKKLFRKLSHVSKKTRDARSWRKIGGKYYEELTN